MKPKQETDAIPLRGIAIALGATVLLTVACIGWVVLVMGPSPEREPPRPDTLDQTLFTAGRGYAAPLLDEQRRTLDSYGWVDRAAGVVRIPIERAIEIVAGETR